MTASRWYFIAASLPGCSRAGEQRAGAEAGRIDDAIVTGEIARRNRLWRHQAGSASATQDAVDIDLEAVMTPQAVAQLDLFDALQLRSVIQVCRGCKSMSDAGRKLYAVSRDAKARPNDADRLKKYLARFHLEWTDIALHS